jgi:hypothetical protein
MSKVRTSDPPSGTNEVVKVPKKKEKRPTKKEMAKLRAELEVTQDENEVLREKLLLLEMRHKELAAAGLDERHKIKLRRLEHLASRIVNMQVCEHCEKKKNAVLEDLKFIKVE